MRRERKAGIMVLVILGLVFGFALVAQATNDRCEQFTNHSGQVPAGWTATFTEDGVDYGPVVGPGYLDPETAHEGNRTWDKAVKCKGSTTTTSPSSTTTTMPTTTTEAPTTTTTAPPETTTTVAEETTTTVEQTTTTQGETTTSQPATYGCRDGQIVEILPGDPDYPGPVASPDNNVLDCNEAQIVTTTTETPPTDQDDPNDVPVTELPYTGISEPFLWAIFGTLFVGAGVGLVLRAGSKG